MTEEQNNFLVVLKDYLNDSEHTYIITDEVVKYVRSHELQAIFYYKTKDSRFLKEYSSTIYFYQNRVNAVEDINIILHGYEYFFVKGIEVAKYYHIPSLRSMGDTDIIVHYDDKVAVSELLKKNGYLFQNDSSSFEWQFSKKNIEFELHHALFYGSEATNKYVQFFSDCFDHVKDQSLEPNYHFVYLIAHLRKHIIQNGAGFRQFMDLAVFTKTVTDWKQVKIWLEEINLTKFAAVAFELIYRWWGVDCSLRGTISCEFYEIATDSIFKNGVFGFENENMRMNTFVSANNSGTQNTFRRIFPPVSVLQHCAGYDFLNKRIWLYPVAIFKHIIDYSNFPHP